MSRKPDDRKLAVEGSAQAPSAGAKTNLILENIAAAAARGLDASASMIVLLDPSAITPGLRATRYGFTTGSHPPKLKPTAEKILARLQQPVLVADVEESPDSTLLDVTKGCEASVPIVADGEVVGALIIHRISPKSLSGTQLDLLHSFALCAALALANPALKEQVNRQKGELEAVLGIGREILSTLDLEEVLTRVARHGARLLNGRVCVLLLLDRLSGELRLRASHGLSHGDTAPLTVPATGTLLGQVVRSGQPLAVSNLDRKPDHQLKGLARREGLRSLVAAPLRSKREVIGVLAVYTGERRTFGKEDLRMATLLATQSAIAIENARLYDEARSTHAELRQSEKLAALGRLSAGLAHEMRNPLNTLNVLVYAMGEKPPQDLKADLAVVKREVDRLRLLLDQFLDFARPRQPRFARERLDEIVEETLLLVRPEAEKRGIAIVRESAPDLPAAWADGMQIRQVLLNVVLNAMQALEHGGTIKTVVREAPDALVIMVEDTGPGIPPEVRERLFDPFFSTKKGGLGLGLSISQRILEAHSGSLGVESEPGAGTRVLIKLPR